MEQRLYDAINDQITKELYSAYLYLAMASYFASTSLDGFAHWMQVQATEETLHAMKFFNFLCDRNQRPVMQAIGEPENEFVSVRDVFEKTLAHEKTVTASINNIYRIAEEVNDNAAKFMLHWFVTEQIEEEKNASSILDKLALVDYNPAGILFLDKELATRAPAITVNVPWFTAA